MPPRPIIAPVVLLAAHALLAYATATQLELKFTNTADAFAWGLFGGQVFALPGWAAFGPAPWWRCAGEAAVATLVVGQAFWLATGEVESFGWPPTATVLAYTLLIDKRRLGPRVEYLPEGDQESGADRAHDVAEPIPRRFRMRHLLVAMTIAAVLAMIVRFLGPVAWFVLWMLGVFCLAGPLFVCASACLRQESRFVRSLIQTLVAALLAVSLIAVASACATSDFDLLANQGWLVAAAPIPVVWLTCQVLRWAGYRLVETPTRPSELTPADTA